MSESGGCCEREFSIFLSFCLFIDSLCWCLLWLCLAVCRGFYGGEGRGCFGGVRPVGWGWRGGRWRGQRGEGGREGGREDGGAWRWGEYKRGPRGRDSAEGVILDVSHLTERLESAL